MTDLIAILNADLELEGKATPAPWHTDDRSFGDEEDPPYGPYGYISTGGLRGKPILQAIQSRKVNDDLRFAATARNHHRAYAEFALKVAEAQPAYWNDEMGDEAFRDTVKQALAQLEKDLAHE